MSQTAKIILGIIAFLVIACIATAALGTALTGWIGYKVVSQIGTDPQEAEQMAAEVADFELPAGYYPDYGVRALGITLSSYTSANENTHLFVAQAGPESNLSVDDVRRIAQESQVQTEGRQDSRNVRVRDEELQLVRQESISVRGKPAELIVSEGRNSSDQDYREMTVLFEGKGGPALITISAPLTVWDEAAYTAFIESIR